VRQQTLAIFVLKLLTQLYSRGLYRRP